MKANSEKSDKPAGLTRLVSGIRGFDEVLGGGLPAGRPTLVTGTTGCGKTVLLNEFLYRGITEHDQGGVFITFEERPADIVRNVASFGWDYPALIDSNRLAMVDLSQQDPTVARSGDFEWDVLFKRIDHAVERVSAERVVIDSVAAAFSRFEPLANEDQVRGMLFRLMDHCKRMGVTALITAEKPTDSPISRHGIEEFVADGVISLSNRAGQNKMIRTLTVVKMRGLYYRSGTVEFDITSHGIEVYPKIPIDSTFAKTSFERRMGTGVTALDEAMGGGIPEGHMMLVAGNTGTGKTLLGMHFVHQGIEQGEKCIWVALEEPVPQVCKTAQSHGWNLEAGANDGGLTFIRAELLDVGADELLYRILRAVEETGAKRVVIDSVSSLESSTMDKSKVREFLIQAAMFFKTRGICCLMNYLSAETFGARGEQLLGGLATNEMRLSSIVDGILLLRYVERDQGVQKLLNVFKLRGSAHTRDILRYEIETGGIKIRGPFDPATIREDA